MQTENGHGIKSDLTEPAAVVLLQDQCFHPDGIDYDRWASTVFLPLLVMSEESTFTLATREALIEHLRELEEKGREIGMASLQTQITSAPKLGKSVAIINTVRHRLAADSSVLGSTSVTFTVIRDGDDWKINQIFFNDSRIDPSIVAMTARSGCRHLRAH